ncbi:MAG: transcription-repair coupling factor [Nitrospiraceae bacterium]|nr:transcription-repair coupling factor [Nitrospiraceae bacterium]
MTSLATKTKSVAGFDALLAQLDRVLNQDTHLPTITGHTRSAKSLLLLRLAQHTSRTMLIVMRSEVEAEAIYGDLLFFRDFLNLPILPLHQFPDWDLSPYQPAIPAVDCVALRMRTLYQLNQGCPTVVVTSISSVLRRTLPKTIFAASCLELHPGDHLERETLIESCLRSGYRNVSIVQDPGELSVRGGIIDLFSTAHDKPVRLEFLGDTLESMRLFDVDSQMSTHKQAGAVVLPAREYILEALPESPLPLGVEWQTPKHYGTMNSLADYCLDPPIIVLNEPQELRQHADKLMIQALEEWSEPATPPEAWYLPWESISVANDGQTVVVTETIPHAVDRQIHVGIDPVNAPIHMACRSPESLGLGIQGAPFVSAIKILEDLRSRGPVVVIARSYGQANRLCALFSEHDVPAELWSAGHQTAMGSHISGAPIYLTHGIVSSGFLMEGFGAIIREEDLFAKSMSHSPQRQSKSAHFLPSVEDIELGSPVVYVEHGIGRYAGLRRLAIHGYEQEFFMIEYAGNDVVYVPLDRMNHVQRYQCQEGHIPRLDSLRGTRWSQTKARVKKNIEDMAEELLELYSRRELVEGVGCSSDSILSHEFDAAFEYEATPDQLTAIEDVKRSMESTRPMDRLVCGDVGYGKTEVAMRAAFKAILDNRQVAVLVPTTLLANQHFENFSQRFAPFPVRVEIVSRFQSRKDQQIVINDVKTGIVDILIGTHRLLQKDIAFKDLGLAIIDEEQWFGVRHKERLKQLFHSVDVLTLTATPIPRTLQLSMSSLRDISIIDTPPAGRLAIKTQVVCMNDRVVREAIQWELRRGGQVFFVHNTVMTIEHIGMWLSELVPEARIGIAHGQMDARVLESVMLRFLRKDLTVLLATSIIQSGMDIPSANTIIVNRADQFGLAQLYQLRGRVGRCGEQAYAYMLVPNEGILSDNAKRRLQAIEEFCELGAGFRIAARDLEIRGAGNLLGKQQSGQIEAVGFELYVQMLEQAVRQRRGEVLSEPVEPQIKLPISAYIADEYVSDVYQRLSLYKRLSSSMQVSDLALLHGEILDRYGPIPDPLEHLFQVMEIKLLARALGLDRCEVNARAITCNFAAGSAPATDAIPELIRQHGDDMVRFPTPQTVEVLIPSQGWPQTFYELRQCLNTMIGLTDREHAEAITL